MARLWSCGFELNSTGSGVEFNSASGTAVSITTTTVRSGTYALRINGLTSGARSTASQGFSAATADGPYFFRTYFRYATLPSANNRIMRLGSSTATDFIVYLTLTSAGTLILSDEDGNIGSASSALTVDTWYSIEIQYDRTPAAGGFL